MRNFLAFLAAVFLIFAVAGWYLGWYKIEATTHPSGNHNVNIDFNSPKFKSDLRELKEKVEKVVEKRKDGSEPAESNIKPEVEKPASHPVQEPISSFFPWLPSTKSETPASHTLPAPGPQPAPPAPGDK